MTRGGPARCPTTAAIGALKQNGARSMVVAVPGVGIVQPQPRATASAVWGAGARVCS